MPDLVINQSKLNGLIDIQETVQHVVSAISAALGVDVAIIDDQFKIIATSKTFLKTRGTDINRDFIRGVYRQGVMVIPNPGYHELCKGCRYEDNCPETAEILRVIEQNGVRYGVLLMVAYTQKQKETFLNNTSNLMDFVSEMANLIYDEIRLQESVDKEKLIQRQLKTTIDFVDSGIITIDHQGRITQINNQAKTIIGMEDQNIDNHYLRDFLPTQIINQLVREGRKVKRCEIRTQSPQKAHCIISANPIMVHQKVMGAVLRIQDFTELRSAVYEFSAVQIETNFSDIQGKSAALLQAKEKAATIAKNDSTILISGESGTGKELFARAIHANSRRSRHPFIAINCAAIPETLLESELFGYEEGAFSGARKGGKPGKFEMADGGTLFLDEISDMPLHMQAKILRAIQEKVIERVGGMVSILVNVRIITATNVSLEKLVKNGGFREDLYYRLNVVPLLIPPLRTRKEDIPVLAIYFLNKYSLKMDRPLMTFSSEAMELLQYYDWPGNIRELQNSVEYAVNMEPTSTIQHSSLPPGIAQQDVNTKRRKRTLSDKIHGYEKMIINEVLNSFSHSGEGKRLAAKELGISLPTLYRKLKQFNL
ncbi:MAG: hypothetical protein CSA34_07135 [Desulfobulbus propionicus]|nr:MAG: hypothetical protein CSA34_07135 [Desulfobulbus propionicus]